MVEDSDKLTESEVIRDLAFAAGANAIQHVGPDESDVAAVLPPGYKVQNLDAWLAAPRRAQGDHRVHDEPSFHAMLQHLQPADGVVVVYGNRASCTLAAVLNEHAGGRPGWRDHRLVCQLTRDPSWEAWVGRDGAMMPQRDFAQHVDDFLDDFVKPEGARMLEIATTLRAKREITFASGISMHNGDVQFTYNEGTQSGAGKSGRVAIPESFEIGIPVHEGGPRYRITARLRYTIEDAQLRIGWRLRRPDLVDRAAWAAICDGVSKAAPRCVVVQGSTRG